jgi:hypothetical protein
MKLLLITFSILCQLFAGAALAQSDNFVVTKTTPKAINAEHQLIRRLAVFPIKTDSDKTKAIDEAWWQTREELANTRRFLVASKQFMVKNEAFQPRSTLEPADTIVLGRLLDAHALIVGELKDRTLSMTVYDAANGFVLWSRTAELKPTATASDQLPTAAKKLIGDFIASVPYQAFQIVDPLIGRATYSDGALTLAQVDVGVAGSAQVGDAVQWVRISYESNTPVFQGGGKITAIAEGRVVKVAQGIATVEVTRAVRRDLIKEFSLVRLPREFERLQAKFAIKDNELKSTTDLTLLSPEAAPMETVRKERKPLLTTGSFIASLAAILLLAF